MVALILAFIFLTPRAWFRDQPRASSIVMLPAQPGTSVFWIEPDLLTSVPEAERPARVEQYLKERYGKKYVLSHLEPISDSEQEIKGFMAYMKP